MDSGASYLAQVASRVARLGHLESVGAAERVDQGCCRFTSLSVQGEEDKGPAGKLGVLMPGMGAVTTDTTAFAVSFGPAVRRAVCGELCG